MAKKRGLGRGLDALLGSQAAATPVVQEAPIGQPASTAVNGKAVDGELRNIPVDLIQRGKYQPRRDMDQEALELGPDKTLMLVEDVRDDVQKMAEYLVVMDQKWDRCFDNHETRIVNLETHAGFK